MKNRNMLWFLLLVISVVLLVACRAERDTNVEPVHQASYFELLGIDKDEIDKIIFVYQPERVDSSIDSQTIMQLNPDDSLFDEIISNFDKMKLTLDENQNWDEMKARYTLGYTQLIFEVDNTEYRLPILDVYEKQLSKPDPVSWAVYQDSFIYTIDFTQCWSKKEYQGVALYLNRLVKDQIAENELPEINTPLYYGLVQNSASWNYDCNASTIFEKSDYIFKGRVLENDLYSGYQIKVLDCYKGGWDTGYVFRYQDGTGYDKEKKVYHALVNETERPLVPDNEYIFFMKKNWMVKPSQLKEGYEAVFLTDRQCGVCQIIDDQVWPIFNALPGTSWYTGQSVEEIRAAVVEVKSFETANTAITNFGVELLIRNVSSEENLLVSPLSVMTMLALVNNGAEGETKSQMEDAIGISSEKLNEYFEEYLTEIYDDRESAVNIANAVIYKENSLQLDEEFVEQMEEVYHARVSAESFDEATLEELNQWVYKQTNRRIPQILNQIEENEVIYLVNALSFDAKWGKKFVTVKPSQFTTETGEVKTVNMMLGDAEYYIEEEGVSGFVKNYEDNRYTFVALLPEEGTSISEYMNSLSGEKITTLLQGAREVRVDVTMPEYEYEYSIGLKETLSEIGMIDLFDEVKADLSKMGKGTDGNLFLNRVIHKTYINVNTSGTKGGAATLGGGMSGGGTTQEVKFVKLDRPFVYLIMDQENEFPIFMGTVMDPGTEDGNK